VGVVLEYFGKGFVEDVINNAWREDDLPFLLYFILKNNS